MGTKKITDEELTARQLRHRKMVTGKAKPKHGTYSTYTNYSCRCDKCRRANREYHRAARKDA